MPVNHSTAAADTSVPAAWNDRPGDVGCKRAAVGRLSLSRRAQEFAKLYVDFNDLSFAKVFCEQRENGHSRVRAGELPVNDAARQRSACSQPPSVVPSPYERAVGNDAREAANDSDPNDQTHVRTTTKSVRTTKRDVKKPHAGWGRRALS